MEIYTLNDICKEKGISLEKLASLLHVKEKVVYSWNNDMSTMKRKQIEKVAKVLNTIPSEIVFGKACRCLDVSGLTIKQIRKILNIKWDVVSKTDMNKKVINTVIDEDNMNFSNTLRYIRARLLGMARDQFSNCIYINASTLANWEHTQEPNLGSIIALSRATGFSIDYFIIDNYPITLDLNAFDEDLGYSINFAFKHYMKENNNKNKDH